MIEFGSVGEILRVSSEKLVDNCDEEQKKCNIEEQEAEISERTEKKECEDKFQGQENPKDNDQTLEEDQDPYEGHYQNQFEGNDEAQVGKECGSDGSDINTCDKQHQETENIKANDQTLAEGQYFEKCDDQGKVGKEDDDGWFYTRINNRFDQVDLKSCKGMKTIKKKQKYPGIKPLLCANRFSILEQEDTKEEEQQNDEF